MKILKITLLALLVTFPTIEPAQATSMEEVGVRSIAGAAGCVMGGAMLGGAGAIVGHGVKVFTKSEAAAGAIFLGSAVTGCVVGGIATAAEAADLAPSQDELNSTEP